MAMMMKYRVHEVAKDFGTTSKVITQILTDYATTPKNHMQVLENPELDVIFEYMTQKNQVASLEDIFKVAPAPEKKPEAPAEAAPAGSAQKTAQKTAGAAARDGHRRPGPVCGRAQQPLSAHEHYLWADGPAGQAGAQKGRTLYRNQRACPGVHSPSAAAD